MPVQWRLWTMIPPQDFMPQSFILELNHVRWERDFHLPNKGSDLIQASSDIEFRGRGAGGERTVVVQWKPAGKSNRAIPLGVTQRTTAASQPTPARSCWTDQTKFSIEDILEPASLTPKHFNAAGFVSQVKADSYFYSMLHLNEHPAVQLNLFLFIIPASLCKSVSNLSRIYGNTVIFSVRLHRTCRHALHIASPSSCQKEREGSGGLTQRRAAKPQWMRSGTQEADKKKRQYSAVSQRALLQYHPEWRGAFHSTRYLNNLRASSLWIDEYAAFWGFVLASPLLENGIP